MFIPYIQPPSNKSRQENVSKCTEKQTQEATGYRQSCERTHHFPWLEPLLASKAFLFSIFLTEEADGGADQTDANENGEENEEENGADNDPNCDQDSEGELEKVLDGTPLSRFVGSRVTLRWIGLFTLALGKNNEGLRWRDKAILASIAFLRRNGAPRMTRTIVEFGTLLPRQLRQDLGMLAYILKNSIEKKAVQEAVCCALCRLTPLTSLSLEMWDNICKRDWEANEGGIETIEYLDAILSKGEYRLLSQHILTSMRAWPHSLPIQKSCTRMIGAMARLQSLRGNLVQQNGLGIVLDAMATFWNDQSFQHIAHSVLRILVRIQDFYINSPAIEQIHNLVENIIGHPEWSSKHSQSLEFGTCCACDTNLTFDADSIFVCTGCDSALCLACHTIFADGCVDGDGCRFAWVQKRAILSLPRFSSGEPAAHACAGHSFLIQGQKSDCELSDCQESIDKDISNCGCEICSVPNCGTMDDAVQAIDIAELHFNDRNTDSLYGVCMPLFVLNLMVQILQRYGKYDWRLREAACICLIRIISSSFRLGHGGMCKEIIAKKVMSSIVRAAQTLPDTDIFDSAPTIGDISMTHEHPPVTVVLEQDVEEDAQDGGGVGAIPLAQSGPLVTHPMQEQMQRTQFLVFGPGFPMYIRKLMERLRSEDGEADLTELAAVVDLADYREKYETHLMAHITPFEALGKGQTTAHQKSTLRNTRHQIFLDAGVIDILTALIRRHTPDDPSASAGDATPECAIAGGAAVAVSSSSACVSASAAAAVFSCDIDLVGSARQILATLEQMPAVIEKGI